LPKKVKLSIFSFVVLRAATVAVNGLQAWEVTDASELRSIGKLNVFS
jgi:hypothetical protein